MRRALWGVMAMLVLAPAASAHVGDPLQLALEWPAQGTVTTPFGFTEGRYHPGLDIGILRSLTVRAAAPGRVTLVGTPTGFSGYGSIVLIDTVRPFQTLYAHLASVDVRPGQWVSAGEPLGVAGCTGWCTGTHLHFEVRDRGQAVDPLPLMR
jgi:murein DD-endopeptidase MepM/ murein hydrolase activator NlpD